MTPAAARGFPGRPARGTLLERMSLHAQARLLADAARAAASPWAGPLSSHQHRTALRELGGVLRDLRATAAALAARCCPSLEIPTKAALATHMWGCCKAPQPW
jgi:hypothetical protein